MSILAIESADGGCSIALWSQGLIEERRNETSRDSLSWLMQQCQALGEAHCPGWQDLDGIACCIGPGGFTGVRVAVGYAQGLGLALDRPVLGVSSLDALAGEVSGDETFWVALDARMGELYAAAYARDGQGQAQRQGEELLITPDALQARLDGAAALYGPGFVAWPDTFPQGRALQLGAAAVARRAALTPLSAWPAAKTLAPTYLRNKVAQTLAERQAAQSAS